MYQVMLTECEYEPWWFFEDWEDHVVQVKEFSSFEEAVQEFYRESQELSNKYPFQKTKNTYLTAYWNESEIHFCDNCDDDIQLFHGLLLLKDKKKIEENRSD
jgi:hypothetical protein